MLKLAGVAAALLFFGGVSAAPTPAPTPAPTVAVHENFEIGADKPCRATEETLTLSTGEWKAYEQTRFYEAAECDVCKSGNCLRGRSFGDVNGIFEMLFDLDQVSALTCQMADMDNTRAATFRVETSQDEGETWTTVNTYTATRAPTAFAASLNSTILYSRYRFVFTGTDVNIDSCTFTTTTVNSDWVQQGTTYFGTQPGDQTGFGVDLTPDGNTMAIGSGGAAVFNNVTVYSRTAGVWTTKGQSLSGVDGTNFGLCVGLSSDGNSLVVGAYQDDVEPGTSTVTNEGSLKIFTYSSTTQLWTQKGTTIFGAAGDQIGIKCAMSRDGASVVTAIAPDTPGPGTVRIYKYGADWALVGAAVLSGGATDSNSFGAALDINADGTRVVVGDHESVTDKGATAVYAYSGTAWARLGQKVSGAAGDYEGKGVSINSAGNIFSTVASGAFSGIGRTTVWKWDAVELAWVIYGAPIPGASSTGYSKSTSLTGLGTAVAVSTWGDTFYEGNVYAISEDETSWDLKGSKILFTADHESGILADDAPIVLDDSATTVLQGMPHHNSTLGDEGAAEVWRYQVV